MPKYEYSVILKPKKQGGYSAEFHDIKEAIASGKDEAEATEAAHGVLRILLHTYETEGVTIPPQTLHEKVRKEAPKKAIVKLIQCDTDYYKKPAVQGQIRPSVKIHQDQKKVSACLI